MKNQEAKNIGKKYWLSTEGYYFTYRIDVNDPELYHATLYKEDSDDIVEDILVNSALRPELSHFNVINRFEVVISYHDRS